MTNSTSIMEQRNQEISDNIARLREQIARYIHMSGRDENDVTLCAVTKTRPVSDCLAALHSGVRDIGENYVQEAREKIPVLRTTWSGKPFQCHLIGHLQTNKIKYAVAFTDIFQTVDSEECLQGIAKSIQKLYNVENRPQAGCSTSRILIEVNLAGDAGRAGVAIEEAMDFAMRARETPGIVLCGFMGMAPATDSVDTARPFFATLRQLFDSLPVENRQILSMGMSGDYPAAIQEGATLLRIGTAIFGARS